MKPIREIIYSIISASRCLALWIVLVLLIPNVVLDCTENSTAVWKIANLAIPSGIYLLILTSSRRTGWMAITLLPAMVLSAFQIVLLYLYGESVIAVDMYLNVATTNMSEASELLENLTPAIIIVIALYLPSLAWGIYAIIRKINMPAPARKELAIWGASLTLFGIGLGTVGLATEEKGSFYRDIFPVNAIANLFEAVNRARQIADYPHTSTQFSYEARSLRNSSEREIYVYVIGETSRAQNWQLYGYHRPTNPRLSQEKNLVFFDRALSESNTTHKSVPMLMSCLSAETFNSINNIKSILSAMKEAGFYTRFFSNQAPNRSYTEYFGNEADDTRYTETDTDVHPYDNTLIGMVHQAVGDTVHRKQFIVLHTYGSHFRYRDRYPQQFSYFKPDNPSEASAGNREELVNSYDNSIRFTDHVIASIIGELKVAGCPTALLYSSDHGEDIYDDARKRFLHASPTPTYYQLHVAMLAWLSDDFCNAHPEMMHNLQDNRHRRVSTQKSMFNTAMDIFGIETPHADRSKSLASAAYTAAPAVYLTDLNEAVPVKESGIKSTDIQHLVSLSGF